MKKVLVLFVFLSSLLFAKVNTVVSILPQKYFLEQIGGDKINIALMVKPGSSPHTYEPKPSQMRDISKADVYFSIGVEFEDVWLHRFEDQNKKMKIVDTTKGIKKIAMAEHHHEEEETHKEHHEHEDEKHENHDEHKHEGLDPHVWTSPTNVKVIAKNILNTLIDIDSANKLYYESNYKKFLTKIEQTDEEIKEILKDTPKHSAFMVFHPAWGYFAHNYDLEQIAIEVSGKNPKPKQIMMIIEEAKEEKVKAIFTAPEFSDKVAKQIANELNIKVIKVSPLNYNWAQNLIDLAQAIANK